MSPRYCLLISLLHPDVASLIGGSLSAHQVRLHKQYKVFKRTQEKENTHHWSVWTSLAYKICSWTSGLLPREQVVMRGGWGCPGQ